jgi:hypothetical protein
MRDFALEVYFSKWEFAAKYNCLRVGFGRWHVPAGVAALRQWLELRNR